MNETRGSFDVIEKYLKSGNTLVLSTCRDGIPRATPLVYKYIRGRILVVSEDGKKFENMSLNNKVSIAVTNKFESFGSSRGLQADGIVRIITSSDKDYYDAAEEYGLTKEAILGNGLYNFLKILEINLTSVTYIDSSVRRGFRILWEKNPGEGFQNTIIHELTEVEGITVERYYPEKITRPNPILFIHGAFHGSWLFHNFQDYFARLGFDTYALNWKGHYISKPDPDLGKRSIIDAVEDAEKVTKQIIKKPPILVGHSMGVLISLKFAERNDAVLAVLLDGAPYKKVFFESGLDKVLTKEGIESNFIITPDYRFKLSAQHAAQSFFDPVLTGKEELARYITLVQEESGKILIDVFTGKIDVETDKIKIPLYLLGKAFSPNGVRLNDIKAKDLGVKDCRVFENMSHDMMLQRDWKDYAGIILKWVEIENQA